MRPTTLLATLCIILVLHSCKQTKNNTDYYIFSKIAAHQKAHDDSISLYHLEPPPPPPPIKPNLRWYCNLVMIFDTASKVFIYQTECHSQKSDRRYESMCDYLDFYEANLNYPHFLGLKPEHLLTIEANYLLDFLKDNETFFRLDTNYRVTNRYF